MKNPKEKYEQEQTCLQIERTILLLRTKLVCLQPSIFPNQKCKYYNRVLKRLLKEIDNVYWKI